MAVLAMAGCWDRFGDGGTRQGVGVAAEFLRAGIDFEHANAARMYDYFLDGAHNFAVDRELARIP